MSAHFARSTCVARRLAVRAEGGLGAYRVHRGYMYARALAFLACLLVRAAHNVAALQGTSAFVACAH
ncbi:hypothetical protein EON67_06375 [archaeon]|nr:MAG: hypothetical protein EON67_06375 [archaeon]